MTPQRIRTAKPEDVAFGWLTSSGATDPDSDGGMNDDVVVSSDAQINRRDVLASIEGSSASHVSNRRTISGDFFLGLVCTSCSSFLPCPHLSSFDIYRGAAYKGPRL